jgi:hypothetical protein
MSATQVSVRLGQVVMTPGAIRALEQAHTGIWQLLERHQRGDWGDVGPEDWQANDWSLAHGERLVSSFTIDGVTVWIVTERDRSSTCILTPDEY